MDSTWTKFRVRWMWWNIEFLAYKSDACITCEAQVTCNLIWQTVYRSIHTKKLQIVLMAKMKTSTTINGQWQSDINYSSSPPSRCLFRSFERVSSIHLKIMRSKVEIWTSSVDTDPSHLHVVHSYFFYKCPTQIGLSLFCFSPVVLIWFTLKLHIQTYSSIHLDCMFGLVFSFSHNNVSYRHRQQQHKWGNSQVGQTTFVERTK